MSNFENTYSVKSNIFLDNARTLIDKWSCIYTSGNKCTGESYQQIGRYLSQFSQKEKLACLDLDTFKDWHQHFLRDQKQNHLDGHNFNIFNIMRDMFGFKVQEVMHSKLIKFLLDEQESHGLGKICLIEFLRTLDIERPEDGNWVITAEQNKVDLLLSRDYPKSVVIIENKSNWAGDQPNQLYRYWYSSIYLKTKTTDKNYYKKNKSRYQIVYLTPNSYKKYDHQSVSKPANFTKGNFSDLPPTIPMQIKMYTFNENIQQWLNSCMLQIPKTNHRVREYIAQYQALCQTL